MKFGAVVSPSPTAIIRQKRREQKAVEWKIAPKSHRRDVLAQFTRLLSL